MWAASARLSRQHVRPAYDRIPPRSGKARGRIVKPLDPANATDLKWRRLNENIQGPTGGPSLVERMKESTVNILAALDSGFHARMGDIERKMRQNILETFDNSFPMYEREPNAKDREEKVLEVVDKGLQRYHYLKRLVDNPKTYELDK
ncbi:uncharacterized protein RCC_05295 [Ramularia collo-cygni]|uniref:Uncharacterized protein n=1 Tax=Ramularia collo-cygni TaxID=112498 RepID=A0A2D3V9Y8_9PEZI|nr:uncharacterized protein RCC_05295 [Ramularia collo-cygni]CZT19444.1 uncharacterized protein RCC_05295 [Ramularia collo-cygni]